MIPTRVTLRDLAWDVSRRALQPWIDGVQSVLAGGATLSETMAGEVRTARFNSDAPPTVTIKATTKPIAVLCLSAKVTGETATVSGFPVEWSPSPSGASNAIAITSLIGATASTDYDIVLWISGG